MSCKKVSIALCLMAVFLDCGSARPAISTKSLGNKLTPSITLVFQSLHNAASFKASKQGDGLPVLITKPRLELLARENLGAMPVQTVKKDRLLTTQGGVFGDAESGKLPPIGSMVPLPIAAN